MIPSEARPPCIGEAAPIPKDPSSQWILTQALRCSGLSAGAQLTWNASTTLILTVFPDAALTVLRIGRI